MTFRSFSLIAVALLLGSSAYADEPPPEALRPPVEFKDLTPPSCCRKRTPPRRWRPDLENRCALAENYGFFSEVTRISCCGRGAGRSISPSSIPTTISCRRGSSNRSITISAAACGPASATTSTIRSGIPKFEYTYFRSRAESSIAAPAGGTLYATLTRAGLNDEADSALATGGLDYNVYDAVLGRRIVLDDRASIRLFGGIRFASIRQSFSAYYNGGDANFGHVEADNGYDGFGAVLGGEMNWNMRYGFSLYARGDAALMTGKLTNPFLETNNGGQTLYAQLDDTTRAVIPVAGVAIGAGWQHDNFSIHAGYEFTNWFGLIQTPRFTGELSEGKFTIRSGDLSLEGFFVQVAYSF